MSKYFVIGFLLNLISINNFVIAQKINCDFQITTDINIINETNNIQPGDTICFKPGFRSFIQFKNIHGTAANPITIINNEGVLLINSDGTYGIKFNNCSHIKLTGSGFNAVPYGIIISKVTDGAGLSIDNKSTNVEIERIEISNTKVGGIYAKTEPDYTGDCTFPAVRDSFTMYNVNIHDCYIHDIGDEGMYIGSSKYMGQTVYHCNDTVVLPHIIEGVKVYNNILERTGWDAIQVSSAVTNCEIHDNYIIEDSYAEEPYQMSGILIGGGSDCDCYNNKIINGKGDGIDYLGFGGNKIYNNLIVKPGITYYPFDSSFAYQKHGIWIGDIYTKPGKDLYIFNNTIIKPRNYGLKIFNSSLNVVNFQNNIVADPMAYQSPGNNPYYDLDYGTMAIADNNSYFTPSVSQMRFTDPANNEYDLMDYSPAINGGMDISSMGLEFDILNRPRPVQQYDIGAYEYQVVDIENNRVDNFIVSVIPNPFMESFNIVFHLEDIGKPVEIRIYNLYGDVIYKNQVRSPNYGANFMEISLKDQAKGYYFLLIKSENFRINETLIKI